MRAAGSLLRQGWRLFRVVLEQVLGTIPALVVANRKLSSRIASLAQTPVVATDPRFRLTLDQIKDHFDVDLQRLARIEEKARATVFGVALSVGLVTPGLTLLTGTAMKANDPKVPSAALLCIAVFFLLASGYLAIQGYKAGSVFRPRPENHPPLVSPEEELETFIRCLDLNELTLLKKNNFLSASIDCLRNGLVATLALLLLVIIGAL
jgi:hypothetical protein